MDALQDQLLNENDNPKCPKCGRRSHMVLHGNEWVCHLTHPILPNAGGIARELAAQDSESPTKSKTKTKGYDLPWIDFAR